VYHTRIPIAIQEVHILRFSDKIELWSKHLTIGCKRSYKRIEIVLPHVDSVHTKGGSTLLGYGSLVIMSTRSRQVLNYVAEAEEFHSHLRGQISRYGKA